MLNNATDLHRSENPSDAPGPAATDRAGEGVAAEDADAAIVEEEILVEEISIDGMCGVY